jgi:hypothetical protein
LLDEWSIEIDMVGLLLDLMNLVFCF